MEVEVVPMLDARLGEVRIVPNITKTICFSFKGALCA